MPHLANIFGSPKRDASRDVYMYIHMLILLLRIVQLRGLRQIYSLYVNGLVDFRVALDQIAIYLSLQLRRCSYFAAVRHNWQLQTDIHVRTVHVHTIWAKDDAVGDRMLYMCFIQSQNKAMSKWKKCEVCIEQMRLNDYNKLMLILLLVCDYKSNNKLVWAYETRMKRKQSTKKMDRHEFTETDTCGRDKICCRCRIGILEAQFSNKNAN